MNALATASAPKRTGRRPATARVRATVSHVMIAASPGERIALPHREVLEERFGRPLDSIAVYAGPTVAAALGELGAVSATLDDQIFLSSESAALPVVAHEVAHALQARREGGSAGVEPEGSAAEQEATHTAAAVARPPLPGDRVSISEGIGRETLALLRVPAHRDGAAISLGLPSATPSLRPRASAPVAHTAGPAAAERSAATTPASAGPAAATPIASTETASETEPAPAGGLELPPAPELTVSPEQVAAQEAAMAEAESALSGAGDAAALLEAYAAAPPTIKARRAATLGSDVAAVSATEGAQWQSDVPDLHASLSGADPPTVAAPVVAPPVPAIDLAVDAAEAAPEPEIPVVEVPGTFEAEQDVTRALLPMTEPDPQALAAQIGDSLDAVQTVDPAVPRSPGPAPGIPLGGETDPARVAEAESAGRAQAAGARAEATEAVLAGPGPEQVQPTSLDEPYAVGELPVPDVAAAAMPEGPAAYVAMELPPEVQVAFDEQQHAAMEQSMAATVEQSEQATADRDTAKESAVSEAEAGVARLNEEADGTQSTAVAAARTDIQTARQDTVDAQQREVERVETEAGDRRRLDESAIQTKVDAEQEVIDSAYSTAERDIGDQVAEGERQAAAAKEDAERKAEDESWWDKAVSFVKDAFNALVDAIGAVFDAVRDAVNDILDAVKAAALAAIDAAANFIKDAIAAYGELLKSVITGLLGEVFPELAAALNSAIDTAVSAAQNAVDSVANALKAGVNALVEGLRAGLMAIIDAYQAAITLALSVAAAAITGDWGALALRVLEAVLRLIGVDPEEFYAFVGRAQETFQMIVDDPAGFLGNVIAVVTGGIQNFADNIVAHLQTGVIGWLTGALGPAGIVLPQSFDLLGVLDLARQILGLTWDLLRAKARKLIGEQNVERLEVLFGFIETLVTEGWGGLWAKIMESVSSVLDLVFDGIKTFIRDRIILAAITKLASLFSPVGAIVQLVLTAWNIYTFLRDQLARMIEVVQTVTTTIGDIARGVLDNAKAAVEGVLARLLPLAIDLLARVIGLGNVGEKVREIVEEVRAMVDKGIDALLQRVAAVFTGGGAAAGAAAVDAESAAAAGATVEDDSTVTSEDHAAYAETAALRLEEESGGEADFASLVAAARVLQETLSARLEPGIGLTFVFPGGETDAADGDLGVDVVIAPNTTTKHGKVSIRGKSAPGIGKEQPHGDKPSSNRSGPELHHTESEHVIPYAIGDALLAVIQVSRGSRKASGKFDGALTTVMIYRGAAERKTNGQDADQELIKKFRQEALDSGIAQSVGQGMVFAAGTGEEAPAHTVDAFAEIVAMIEDYRADAVTRTNQAIVDEHAQIAAGFKTTNGKRRGEAAGIPDPAQILSVATKQYKEIFVYAAHLFSEGGGVSALGPQPESAPRALQTVTLAQLNEMTSAGEFRLISGIGGVLAERLLAARPFASLDDLEKVPGIGPTFLARVTA